MLYQSPVYYVPAACLAQFAKGKPFRATLTPRATGDTDVPIVVLHKNHADITDMNRNHGEALQRVGTALGLEAGSDVHVDTVRKIGASNDLMRRAADALSSAVYTLYEDKQRARVLAEELRKATQGAS